MRRLGTLVASITAMGLLAPSLALAQDPPPQEPPAEGQNAEEHAALLSTDPDDDTIEETETGPLAGVLDHLQRLIAVAAEPAAQDAFRTVDPVHVTVITTGVDTTVLGDGASAVEVTALGSANGDDALGWGTWATSVLLQAADAITVDVVDVYPADLPDEGALATALANVVPEETDAVLLAFPPGDVLDPMLRLLASNRTNDFFDAALETIVAREDGSHVVGIPLDATTRAAAEYVGGWAGRRDVRSAASMITRWETIVDEVAALAAAGLPVIVPAGDVGPTPQTILGLAGLPDVITVGAADASGAVVASSARGPSVHGTAKPDVVAPVMFAGVLPDAAAISQTLDGIGLVDGALDVVLDGAVGATRTASVSTISAAAGVTAAIAAVSGAGTDLMRVRGALMAAAIPTDARDVLAEGAGVLEQLPTLALLEQPLVSGPLDLGMEPDDVTQPWAAAVDVIGGAPQPAEVVLNHWVGTGLDGRRQTAVVGPDGQPEVQSVVVSSGQADDEAVTLRDGRLGLWLAPGDNSWEPGVFCGYSRVDLIGTSSSVDSEATVGTGPVVVPEDVPTCLVEGMRLDILNFYIHNLPAQDFTMTLLPNLPAGMDIIEGPTMVLPVHPTKEKLYSKISGEDGYTTFGAVVPGFYRMRQFSDYSIDVAEDHPSGTIERNLGNPLTYSTKDALILPDSVCQVPREDRGGKPDPCHVDLLDDIDALTGDGEVGYDKTTGRYFVDIPGIDMGDSDLPKVEYFDQDLAQLATRRARPSEVPIVLGWAKKMQLTVVSSRYVDAMGGADWVTDLEGRTAETVTELLADLVQVEEFGAVVRPLGREIDALANGAVNGAAAALGLGEHWTWSASPEPGEPLTGTYSGLSLENEPTSVMGMVDYPFSLTTPNYKGSIDWNFTYELDEVAVVAVVEINKERHVALFTPAGVVSLSPITTEAPIDPVGMLEVSSANGVAHLKYLTHPRGAASGLLTLYAFPLEPTEPARLVVGDMSMEITTWQRIEWPPTTHDRDGQTITGHSFRVQPRWNARQMSDKCHTVDASLTGGFAGQVCDEWDLFVHSGRYDVETFRILDVANGNLDFTGDFRASGALFHDPMRRVTDATLALAHRATVDGLVGVDQSVRRELRSNGEFFEVLHLPDALVRAHGGEIEFQQADNIVGRLAETVTSHQIGSVPLTGYLRFAAQHVDAEGLGLPTSSTVLGAMAASVARVASSSVGLDRSARIRTILGAAEAPEEPAPPPPAPSSVSELEQVFVDGVDAVREQDGVDPASPVWDVFDAARTTAAGLPSNGLIAPNNALSQSVCCATQLLQSVGAASVPSWDTDATATARQVMAALAASSGRADLVDPATDHLGVGVHVSDDGTLYAVLAHRAWDGSDVPTEPPPPPAPEPEPTPTPTPAPAPAPGGGGSPLPDPGPAPAPDAIARTDAADETSADEPDAPSTGSADQQGVVDDHDHDPDARPVSELAYLCDLGRLAGGNREDTAGVVSANVFGAAPTVMIAASDGFADALTGATLAAAEGAPILLNPTDVGAPGDRRGLASAVVAELERLQPSRIVLLGGLKALSQDVEAELRLRFDAQVVRLSGANRYTTATAIADAVDTGRDVRHAYLVEGTEAWPDAVSVAAVAGHRRSPILLTYTDRLHFATASWLIRSDVTHVTIVGGSGVVSSAVREELLALGLFVDRLSGTNRYETSVAVAEHAVAKGMSSEAVWVATGRNYPDALAAGPAAAALGVPLLLVDGQGLDGSPASRAWLRARADQLTCALVIGGPGVVSPAVAEVVHGLA